MKPVFQTKFGIEGNCFAACVASIFDLNLEQVPHTHGQGWQPMLGAFLNQRGLVYLEVPRGNLLSLRTDDPPRQEQPLGWQPLIYGDWPLCILAGPSPRFAGIAHAVVGESNGYGFRILHDPHPDGSGLTDVTQIGFFVPIVVPVAAA